MRAAKRKPGFPGRHRLVIMLRVGSDGRAALKSTVRAVDVGTLIGGKYTLESLIARGGMGEVWSASHGGQGGQGERCALKLMLPSTDDNAAKRFLREASVVRGLMGEHIPRVFEVGDVDEHSKFMAMELLEGVCFSDLIRARSPLPINEAVALLLQAIEGVGEAHAHGIVHRDLKPSNLFLAHQADGQRIVKVLDFGISRALPSLTGDDASSLTATGATLGTPGYLSPEQLRGARDVDARTDVWALGLLLHKMLTGRAAFDAADVGEYFAMIVTEPPTPLRQELSDAPAALERLIFCCAERKRERRFQDVGQLARALLPFAPEEETRVIRIERTLKDAGVASGLSPEPASPQSPGSLDTQTMGTTAAAQILGAAPGSVSDDATEAARAQAPTPQRRSPAMLVALSLAALSVGGLAAFSVAGSRAPTAAVTLDPNRHTAPETASETAPVERTSPAPTQVAITLDIHPSGAVVSVNGVRDDANPLSMPADGQPRQISVKAKGYDDYQTMIRPQADATMIVRLSARDGENSRPRPMRRPAKHRPPTMATAPKPVAVPPPPTRSQGPIETEL